MKKTLSFFGALAATAFILSSCGGDDPAAPFLTVKGDDGKAPASTVSFDAAAGSKKFTVESNGKWSISKPESAAWLTVNPSSGTGTKTVSISAETCAQLTARTAVLKFMLEGAEKASFTIQQSGAEAYLIIKGADNKAAADKLAFEAAAGEAAYTIESNAAWSVTGAADWLKVEPASGSNNGTVKVSAAANTTFETRTATLKFLMDKAEKLAVAVSQKASAPYITVTEPEMIPYRGGSVTLTVETNVTDWKAEVTESWISIDKAAGTATTVVLKSTTANTGNAPKTAKVSFKSASQPSAGKEVTVSQDILKADMIDVEFKQDGTAVNAAAWNIPVQTIAGANMSVDMNATYGRYAARFTHANPGSESADSFYKIDFRDDDAFKNAISDGHSIECLFMANFEPGGLEVKPFGAHEGGGTGILVCNLTDNRQNNITFLPHTQGAYRWALSGVKPAVGTFYHVVGVYDKAAGKAYTYINGELKGTGDAPGDYTMPGVGAQWFAVGGDATGSGKAGNVWNGDVVIARLYNDALTQEEITMLWNRVKK